MNSSTITVHWHDENQPIYSVDFQPNLDEGPKKSERLVTGGGDNNVRVWKLNYTNNGGNVGDGKDNENSSIASIEYLSTLRKHTQAVNVVRFDPKGEMLASAGDDGTLILWVLSDHIIKEFGEEEDDEIKESWTIKHIFRSSTSEIYDLSWSPDSKFIATGSMDNITRIYNVTTGQQVYQLAEHNHYVQGVAWDPRNEFLATQSADRSVHIYSLKNKNEIELVPTIYFKILRSELPISKLSLKQNIDILESEEEREQGISEKSTSTTSMDPPVNNFIQNVKSPSKQQHKQFLLPAVKQIIKKKSTFLYHSETLQSFFRRLTFSPDGSLLLTPSGIYKTNINNIEEYSNEDNNNEDLTNTVYIYIRSGLNKSPVCHIPGLKKPAIAIKFSPIIYRLSQANSKQVFKLPYKMIFAIATQDSIIIYNTENLRPLGIVSNLHYSTITDLVWNKDGQSLIISSADGFCSNIVFDEGIFGEILYNSIENKSFWELRDEAKMEAKGQIKEDSKSITELLNKPNKESKINENNLGIKAPTTGKRETLDQFIAKPIEEESNSPTTAFSNNEGNQQKKKRRVIPTLVTK